MIQPMVEESRTAGLAAAGRSLSRGLLAYGIVGLVVSAIGFGAIAWVNTRINDIRSEARANVATMANTLGLAAVVLRDASTTGQSFSVTADQASRAAASVAASITEVRSELSSVEAQLRSVSILGATPLASSADAVRRIGASMDGLDIRVSLIADALNGNRAALGTDAASLARLADAVDALADRLRAVGEPDAAGEIEQVVTMALLMFAAWSLVPAIGALGIGLWLRRWQARPTP